MNLDHLRNWRFSEITQTYSLRDTLLYALSVGCGSRGLEEDDDDIPFVYERNIQALPTMATVLGSPGFWLSQEGTGVDWRKVLHAGQSVQMHRPLCAEGSVVSRARVEDVLWQEDRRRAKISIQRDLYDSISKNPVATLRSILFVGMDAAYGSKAARASAGMSPGPTRSPDHTCEIRLANNLALLYRLNGDYNPLHADREAAHISGFSRPILHGLCTYGAVGRALIRELCGNNAGSMKRLTVRFAGHVFPGEKLRVEIWRDGHHKAKFQARCVERNSLVVDQGEVEFVTA